MMTHSLKARLALLTKACLAGLLVLCLFSLARVSQVHAQGDRNKQICANNLKNIAIALILYSNDYRFFPHMVKLNEEHKPHHVSKVFRTLIYFKYIDEVRAFICPDSADRAIKLSDDVINNPKKFQWGTGEAGGGNVKPIHGGKDPSIFENRQLSYTYLKRKLNGASARSDTTISADKVTRTTNKGEKSGGACPSCKSDQSIGYYCMKDGNLLIAEGGKARCQNCDAVSSIEKIGKFCRRDGGKIVYVPPPGLGGHYKGYNIVYADGHVSFGSADDERIKKSLERLIMPTPKKEK